MKAHTDVQGRPFFEFADIRASRYSRIAKNLARRFKLQPEGKFVDTTEEKLQEYSSGALMVSIEWADATGLSVHSRSEPSDVLTTQIAEYVQKKYRA